MTPAARKALEAIRECVDADRYVVTRHFAERMDQRGLMWPDVLGVVDEPDDVRDGGPEGLGRPKWLVAGAAADGLPIELVCVIDTDASGRTTLFVTLYHV